MVTITDPVRGTHVLTHLHALALLTLDLGYPYLRDRDALALIFLGMIEKSSDGFALTQRGREIVQSLKSEIEPASERWKVRITVFDREMDETYGVYGSIDDAHTAIGHLESELAQSLKSDEAK
jgi:hypothetical protein